MQTSIVPVIVGRNTSGSVSASALNFFTNFDDQATQATWFYQFGTFVTPLATDEVPDPDPVFTGIDNAIGNLQMVGTDYTGWDGGAVEAKAWVLAQLNLTAA